MAKLFILTGIVLLLVGLIIFAAERFGLGRLPGDIVIEREGFTLYLPLATSLAREPRAHACSLAAQPVARSPRPS